MHSTGPQRPPRAFLSYCRKRVVGGVEEDHADLIAWLGQLGEWLRSDGVTVWSDQHAPCRDDFGGWMSRGLRQADVVVVVCTPAYRQRYEGGQGTGVGWEAWELRVGLQGGERLDIHPVLVEGLSKPADIPPALVRGLWPTLGLRGRPDARFLDAGYVRLLRAIHGNALGQRPSTNDEQAIATPERAHDVRRAIDLARRIEVAGHLTAERVQALADVVRRFLPQRQEHADRLLRPNIDRSEVLHGAVLEVGEVTRRDPLCELERELLSTTGGTKPTNSHQPDVLFVRVYGKGPDATIGPAWMRSRATPLVGERHEPPTPAARGPAALAKAVFELHARHQHACPPTEVPVCLLVDAHDRLDHLPTLCAGAHGRTAPLHSRYHSVSLWPICHGAPLVGLPDAPVHHPAGGADAVHVRKAPGSWPHLRRNKVAVFLDPAFQDADAVFSHDANLLTVLLPDAGVLKRLVHRDKPCKARDLLSVTRPNGPDDPHILTLWTDAGLHPYNLGSSL